MSANPYGKYTDEDGTDRPLHNHNTAIIGGPPSRHRHYTPFTEQNLAGKALQIAIVAVILLFNAFLGWGVGRMIGLWTTPLIEESDPAGKSLKFTIITIIMGRTQPTKPAPIPKPIRAKTARYTIHKTIPALLSSNPRAHQGVQSSELITSPAALPSAPLTAPTITSNSSPTSPPLKIRILHTDTLTAASSLCSPSPTKSTSCSKPHNPIAILNMASPLRPGGGVLNGVTSSQEEFLCLRTTLYPSLHENFYRLPDIGGIWTPNVLVFRDKDNVDLPKDKRYYVDVLSAAMLRFPDTEVGAEGEERYVEDKDRETMIMKMTAVMRILAAKGAKKVVLGAWGCGAYKNPIGEITRGWRRVLVGGSRKGREIFGEVEEVIFAISEWRMVEGFRRCLGDVCREEEGDGGYEDSNRDIAMERERGMDLRASSYILYIYSRVHLYDACCR